METNVDISTVDKFYEYVRNLSLNGEKGDRNEHDKKNPLTALKGRKFEVFCLFYLKFHPAFDQDFEWVKLYEDVDPELKGRIGLPEKDKGTDLVAKWKVHYKEERDNYVCIQAKFRSNQKHQFNKGELATFFSDYRIAGGGIFMTNCFPNVNIEGENKHHVQCIQVVDRDIQEFEKENPGLMFEILNSTWKYFGGNSLPLNKITRENNSRKYQEECFVKAEEHFKENNRGILQSPTGTGKTFEQKIIVYEVVRKILKKEVQTAAFFAPKIVLLKQTSSSYYSEENEVIIICSEKEKTAGRNVFVSTKMEEIQERLKKRNPKKNLFVFITYASSQLFVSTLEKTNKEEEGNEEEKKPMFDFFVFDECHNLTGKSRFALPKFISKNDFTPLTEKMLFLTATPRNVIGKDVVSMDNEEIFGKMFYSLSLYEAIRIGALCDYHIRIPIASTITLERIRYLVDIQEELFQQNETYVDEGEKQKDPIQVGWRILMAVFTIIEAFQNGKKKVIAFASNKKRCQKINELVSNYFRKQGKQDKFYGNCILSDEKNCNSHNKRQEIFRQFTSNDYDFTLLCSVRILVEGYDAPECDCVCLCDPISSKIAIMQMVGRGLRKNGDKTLEVLIPVILQAGEEFGDAAWQKGGDFYTVRNVLLEVNKADGRIFDEVHLKKTPKFTLGKLTVREMARKDNKEIDEAGDTGEAEELELFSLDTLEDWKSRLIEGEELRETPEEKLQCYLQFVRLEKRLPKQSHKKVEERGKEEQKEFSLYNFGKNNIKTKKVKLSEEERTLLEENGFIFDIKERKETPKERLHRYLQFVRDENRLPKQSQKKAEEMSEEEQKENSLYNFGRKNIKTKKVTLTAEERNLLVENGFTFERNEIPEERLQRYLQFVRLEKRLPKFSKKKVEEMGKEEYKEHSLYHFGLNNIKTEKVTLTKEERTLMEENGFTFERKEILTVEEKLQLYLQFVRDEKRLPKYSKKKAEERGKEEQKEHSLYIFGLNNIKTEKVTLSEEERTLLEENGFTFK